MTLIELMNKINNFINGEDDARLCHDLNDREIPLTFEYLTGPIDIPFQVRPMSLFPLIQTVEEFRTRLVYGRDVDVKFLLKKFPVNAKLGELGAKYGRRWYQLYDCGGTAYSFPTDWLSCQFDHDPLEFEQKDFDCFWGCTRGWVIDREEYNVSTQWWENVHSEWKSRCENTSYDPNVRPHAQSLDTVIVSVIPWTPLQYVCAIQNYKMILLLLEEGGDPTILDDVGRSSYDLFMSNMVNLVVHPDIERSIVESAFLYQVNRRIPYPLLSTDNMTNLTQSPSLFALRFQWE